VSLNQNRKTTKVIQNQAYKLSDFKSLLTLVFSVRL